MRGRSKFINVSVCLLLLLNPGCHKPVDQEPILKVTVAEGFLVNRITPTQKSAQSLNNPPSDPLLLLPKNFPAGYELIWRSNCVDGKIYCGHKKGSDKDLIWLVRNGRNEFEFVNAVHVDGDNTGSFPYYANGDGLNPENKYTIPFWLTVSASGNSYVKLMTLDVRTKLVKESVILKIADYVRSASTPKGKVVLVQLFFADSNPVGMLYLFDTHTSNWRLILRTTNWPWCIGISRMYYVDSMHLLVCEILFSSAFPQNGIWGIDLIKEESWQLTFENRDIYSHYLSSSGRDYFTFMSDQDGKTREYKVTKK